MDRLDAAAASAYPAKVEAVVKFCNLPLASPYGSYTVHILLDGVERGSVFNYGTCHPDPEPRLKTLRWFVPFSVVRMTAAGGTLADDLDAGADALRRWRDAAAELQTRFEYRVKPAIDVLSRGRMPLPAVQQPDDVLLSDLAPYTGFESPYVRVVVARPGGLSPYLKMDGIEEGVSDGSLTHADAGLNGFVVADVGHTQALKRSVRVSMDIGVGFSATGVLVQLPFNTFAAAGNSECAMAVLMNRHLWCYDDAPTRMFVDLSTEPLERGIGKVAATQPTFGTARNAVAAAQGLQRHVTRFFCIFHVYWCLQSF